MHYLLNIQNAKIYIALARLSEKLPDDGHKRPKTVGATYNILM
jgi:hypothetical protein